MCREEGNGMGAIRNGKQELREGKVKGNFFWLKKLTEDLDLVDNE
jgi:hypothetical protein